MPPYFAITYVSTPKHLTKQSFMGVMTINLTYFLSCCSGFCLSLLSSFAIDIYCISETLSNRGDYFPGFPVFL